MNPMKMIDTKEVQSNEHGGIKGIGVIEEMNFDGAYFFELFWSDTIKLFWPVRPLLLK